LPVTTATKADLSLVLVALLWGSSFVVIKGSLTSFTPLWLVFLRFLVASLALLVFSPGFWRGLQISTVWYSLLAGLCLYAGFALQTLGLQYTSPAKSAFITGSSIVMVPLLNLSIFRVGFRKEVGLGILMAFAGLYLLTRPDDLNRMNRGDGLTFLCALGFAFHIIFIGRYAVRSPYKQLALLQIFWALLFSWAAALLSEVPRFNYSALSYLALVYLGVLCSALAFFVQTHAQQYTSASRTALLFSLEPVFAVLLSIVFYGERLMLVEWFGGFLIVAGVIAGERHVLESNEEQFSERSV
jgi:drug/metabolite transporter (DMT)-like permease